MNAQSSEGLLGSSYECCYTGSPKVSCGVPERGAHIHILQVFLSSDPASHDGRPPHKGTCKFAKHPGRRCWWVGGRAHARVCVKPCCQGIPLCATHGGGHSMSLGLCPTKLPVAWEERTHHPLVPATGQAPGLTSLKKPGP